MFGMKGEEEYGGRGGRSSHSTLSNSLTFRSLLQIRSASPYILLFKFNLKPSTHLPSRNFLPYPESILSSGSAPPVPSLPQFRACRIAELDSGTRLPAVHMAQLVAQARFRRNGFSRPSFFEFLHFWFSFLVWH